jgi:DNA-binding CsgD family transcriptional regulator
MTTTTPVELTGREYQVLVLVSLGLTNLQIANRLHLSEQSAKTHLRRIFAILGVDNRCAAIRAGYDHGFLFTGQTVIVPVFDQYMAHPARCHHAGRCQCGKRPS